MPTAQDLAVVGYERQGHLFQILAQMLSGIAAQGGAYVTTTMWEATRSFYVGWKWAMDALGDGFRAAAYDPAVSTIMVNSLGGVAANSSIYFGSPSGGRGYLSTAASQAFHASAAFNDPAQGWGAGASYLFQRAAEVYSLFWRNAP